MREKESTNIEVKKNNKFTVDTTKTKTVDELVDSIRNKIQHTLKKNVRNH